MAAHLTNVKIYGHKNTPQLFKLTRNFSKFNQGDTFKFLASDDTTDTVKLCTENKSECAIKCNELVISAAVSPRGIYLATKDGSILRISDTNFNDLIRTSKQYGKSHSEQACAAEQDIFGSLLEEQEKAAFVEQVKTFYCSAENILLNCPGIQVIHAAGGYLVALSLEENVWEVLVYHLRDFDAPTNKPEKEPVLSVKINAGCDKTATKPVLSLVKPFDKNQNVESDCLQLNKVLYNQLFGVDCNLLDTAVILLGLSNGHVYAIPIKTSTNVSLLHQCQNPVVGIHGMVLEESDSKTRDLLELSFGPKQSSHLDAGLTSLAFICSSGKIFLIHGSTSCKEPIYLDQYLPGPVISSAAIGSSVVLSTWIDLYKVEMKLKNDEQGHLTVESEKTKLGYGHLTDILYDDSEGPLFAINDKGRIFRISLDNSNNHMTGQTRQGVYGVQMKELLSKVTKISEKLLKESTISESVDKILAHLNLATSIHLENSVEELTITCGNCGKHQTPLPSINWSVKVLNISQGLYSNYFLEVNLENSSNILLESGWKFAVSLVPTDDIGCAKNYELACFILPKLQSHSKCSMNVPVDSDIILNLPLVIQPTLILNPNVPSTENSIEKFFQSVCVKLKPIRLNILDFCIVKKLDEQSYLRPVEPSFSEQLKTLSDGQKPVTTFGIQQMQPPKPLVKESKSLTKPKSRGATAQGCSTSSFLVDEREQCQKCLEMKDVSPETRLLNQLLLLDSTTNTLSSVQLVLPKGGSVSVEVKKAKGGKLEVSLQGPNMAVVQEMQLALRSRLVKSSSSRPGCETFERRHMNQVLQEYESLRKELHTFSIQLKKHLVPEEQMMEKLVGIHRRLRDINLDTTGL